MSILGDIASYIGKIIGKGNDVPTNVNVIVTSIDTNLGLINQVIKDYQAAIAQTNQRAMAQGIVVTLEDAVKVLALLPSFQVWASTVETLLNGVNNLIPFFVPAVPGHSYNGGWLTEAWMNDPNVQLNADGSFKVKNVFGF